jgi:hypothetical protein
MSRRFWSCVTLVSWPTRSETSTTVSPNSCLISRSGSSGGGTPVQTDIELLANKDTHPHIIVGAPGRINALVRDRHLRLANLKRFVLDECDKMLDQPGETVRMPSPQRMRVLFLVEQISCCSRRRPGLFILELHRPVILSKRGGTRLCLQHGRAHIRSPRCTRHDFRHHRYLRTLDLLMFSLSLFDFKCPMPRILLGDVK